MPLPPAWAAFKPSGEGDDALVMGDTVVFQDEMDAAMDAAFAHGLEVTALHNHMLGEQPAYYFTRFWGKGSAAELARGFKAALEAQARTGN